MKRILFTSTALVAFAGAAAAEVSWSGDAKLGYNDDVKNGVYWSVGLGVSATAELNNGLEAGISLDVDLEGDNNTYGASEVKTSDYVLHLKSDVAGLYFGDTATASESLWTSASGTKEDRFAEKTDAGEEAQIRAELTMGSVQAALSAHVVSSNGGANDDIVGYQFAAKYDGGSFSAVLAYQDEDNPNGEILGITGMGTFGAADVKLTYADAEEITTGGVTQGGTTMGIEVGYTISPVDLTVYYATNENAGDRYGISADYSNGPVSVNAYYDGGDNVSEFGLEGSYDVGNGLVMKAGFISNQETDNNAMYIAGEYDLGGDAALLVSYADDEGNAANDEIGDPEYMSGATVEVSFKF